MTQKSFIPQFWHSTMGRAHQSASLVYMRFWVWSAASQTYMCMCMWMYIHTCMYTCTCTCACIYFCHLVKCMPNLWASVRRPSCVNWGMKRNNISKDIFIHLMTECWGRKVTQTSVRHWTIVCSKCTQQNTMWEYSEVGIGEISIWDHVCRTM